MLDSMIFVTYLRGYNREKDELFLLFDIWFRIGINWGDWSFIPEGWICLFCREFPLPYSYWSFGFHLLCDFIDLHIGGLMYIWANCLLSCFVGWEMYRDFPLFLSLYVLNCIFILLIILYYDKLWDERFENRYYAFFNGWLWFHMSGGWHVMIIYAGLSFLIGLEESLYSDKHLVDLLLDNFVSILKCIFKNMFSFFPFGIWSVDLIL